MAFNGQQGLAMSSDHSRDGGVNPLLALASGGAFANVDVPLGGATTVSVGLTSQSRLWPLRSLPVAERARRLSGHGSL